MTGTFDIEYKQVQWIDENDNRSFDERMSSLPFIRDEDLPEWEEWANRAFPGAKMYVNNNR
jgi:hypothetical protein